jgi:hypothetical protein
VPGGAPAALFLARCSAAAWHPAGSADLLAAHALAYPLTTVVMLVGCLSARRWPALAAMLMAMPLLCPAARAAAEVLGSAALQAQAFGVEMLGSGAALHLALVATLSGGAKARKVRNVKEAGQAG